MAEPHDQEQENKRREQRDPNAAAEELGRRAKQPARPGSPAEADQREAAAEIAERESYPRPS